MDSTPSQFPSQNAHCDRSVENELKSGAEIIFIASGAPKGHFGLLARAAW
jgi:hypothetical protein